MPANQEDKKLQKNLSKHKTKTFKDDKDAKDADKIMGEESDQEDDATKIHDQAYKFRKFRAYVAKRASLRTYDFSFKQVIGRGTYSTFHFVTPSYTKAASKHASLVLKVMKKEKILAANAVKSFHREQSLLKQLDHPFVNYLISSFQDAYRLYQLFEFAPYGSLYEYLGETGILTDNASVFYAGTVLLAIEYLQSINVTHRDLKPENILLTRRGYPLVINFSFAKVIKPGERTWTLCGTPEYMAPEIVQSEGTGRTTDYWAYGVMIYEFSTGFSPFFDEDCFIIFQKILANRIYWPKHIAEKTKHLIGKFLKPWTERLGCNSAGASLVKKQEFFKGFDFHAAEAMKLTSPRGKTLKNDDLSFFTSYPNTIDDCEKVDIDKEILFDPSYKTDEDVFIQSPLKRRQHLARDSTMGLFQMPAEEDEKTENAEIRVLETMAKDNKIPRATLRAQTAQFEETLKRESTVKYVAGRSRANLGEIDFEGSDLGSPRGGEPVAPGARESVVA